MRCAVFGCTNHKKMKSNENPELKFYLFPKNDPKLLEKWVKFCRRPRPNSFNIQSARICGDHFREKDKERNIKYEMGFQKNYCPQLRPGATPCIYPETKVALNKMDNLGSFPTVMLENESEHSQQSLCDADEDNYLDDKDPLTAEEKKLKIPLVNLSGQQTPIVNKINEGTETPQAAFKGILAVLYPVDGAGKPPLGSLGQNSVQAATLPNENFLEQIRELKKENDILKKNEKMHKKTIKSLQNEVIKANYDRDNLEKKLKTIFTDNQIRHFKTGKRVIWSVEDMSKAVKLYQTSPTAYNLLKNQNYPFPAQKTVQVWIKMSQEEMKEGTSPDELQNNTTECFDTSFVDHDPSTVNIVTEKHQMNEFLTFHPSTTVKTENHSISFTQNAIENQNCSSVMDDHSYY